MLLIASCRMVEYQILKNQKGYMLMKNDMKRVLCLLVAVVMVALLVP